jgi:hypothetical protein
MSASQSNGQLGARFGYRKRIDVPATAPAFGEPTGFRNAGGPPYVTFDGTDPAELGVIQGTFDGVDWIDLVAVGGAGTQIFNLFGLPVAALRYSRQVAGTPDPKITGAGWEPESSLSFAF